MNQNIAKHNSGTKGRSVCFQQYLIPGFDSLFQNLFFHRMFKVLSKKMAPNTIQRTETVIPNPWKTDASTRVADISQNIRAIATVKPNATGMAFLAGQLRPTNKMAATTIGENATRASRVSLIGTSSYADFSNGFML